MSCQPDCTCAVCLAQRPYQPPLTQLPITPQKYLEDLREAFLEGCAATNRDMLLSTGLSPKQLWAASKAKQKGESNGGCA